MTIVDVRIVPLGNGFSLDTYVFMELDHRTEIDDARLQRIHLVLSGVLAADDDAAARVTRPAPRQVRMFTTRTIVTFSADEGNDRTIMELVASDRPGLLSTVGRVFVDQGLDIETAKVLTIGERAEDVFYIVDASKRALDADACALLKDKLIENIDNNT